MTLTLCLRVTSEYAAGCGCPQVRLTMGRRDKGPSSQDPQHSSCPRLLPAAVSCELSAGGALLGTCESEDGPSPEPSRTSARRMALGNGSPLGRTSLDVCARHPQSSADICPVHAEPVPASRPGRAGLMTARSPPTLLVPRLGSAQDKGPKARPTPEVCELSVWVQPARTGSRWP